MRSRRQSGFLRFGSRFRSNDLSSSDLDPPCRQRIFVEKIDEAFAPLLCGALIHIALVGDLVTVDGWRLGHEKDALDAAGGTRTGGIECREFFADECLDF